MKKSNKKFKNKKINSIELPIGKIICGDCIEVMPKLSTNQIKLILTDPPYQWINKKDNQFNTPNPKSGDFFAIGNNKKNFEKISSTFGFRFNPNKFLKLALKICHPFNAYIFTSKGLLETYLKFARMNSFSYDILIWNVLGVIPTHKGHYSPDKNYCIFLREKGATFHSSGSHQDYLTVYTSLSYGKRETGHPTEKPLTFIKRMIKISSNPNDIILDPYVGSGTTCVAAEQLGRRWIGIDTSKEYCEMARKRIAYIKRNPGFKIFK